MYISLIYNIMWTNMGVFVLHIKVSFFSCFVLQSSYYFLFIRNALLLHCLYAIFRAIEMETFENK